MPYRTCILCGRRKGRKARSLTSHLRHLKQPRAIYEPEVEDDLRHLQQHRAIYEPEVYAGILDKEVADYGEEGDSANQKCVEAELDELAPAGKS